MTKRLLSLLLIIGSISLYSSAFGQANYIKLKPISFEISFKGFYVDSVIDIRPIQYSIGYMYIGSDKIREEAFLEQGVSVELANYLNYALPKKRNAVPIILKVIDLQISEELTNYQEKGIALLKMAFYTRKNGADVLVCNAESKVEDVTPKVGKHHEQRIRKALEECLVQFSRAYNDSQYISDNTTNLTNQKSDLRLSNSKISYIKPDRNYMLILSYNSGHYTAGPSVSYIFYKTTPRQRWIFPFTFTFDYLSFNEKMEESINSFRYIMPGILPMRKLTKGVWISPGIQFPLGWTNTSYVKDLGVSYNYSSGYGWNVTMGEKTDFVFGVNPSLSLKFMPDDKEGILLGFSAFSKYFTSKYYSKDYGFKIDLGVKF